jgi:hypothetical protein
MTTAVAEALWLRLRLILAALADRLAAADPTLIRDLGRTANDAFLLRGYLALKRHKDGDEVAITVDVRSDGRQLTVESDVCTDDGEVIAGGPSTSIELSETQSRIDTAVNDWLRDFEQFLQMSETAVVKAASTLK